VEWIPTNGGNSVNETVDLSSTSYTIMSLDAFTSYNITVYASTAIGEGDGVTVIEDTLPGGKMIN